MPNTLVHFGVQGALSRGLKPDIDLRWVFLGCVIPDIPWILQRGVLLLVPGFDPYALRLYAIVQATLFVSLLLCAALAAIARRPGPVFVILAANTLLHLLLDALQTKWGNGVHLFAPLSWQLGNYGLFWPESPLVAVLSVAGLALALWYLLAVRKAAVGFSFRPARLALCVLFLAGYYLLPMYLLDAPAAADNHSVRTLRDVKERTGRAVAFDRNAYVPDGRGGGILTTYTREDIRLTGELPATAGRLSARGIFIDPHTVRVSDVHLHATWFRDGASYLGLTLLVLVWIPWRRLSPRRKPLAGQ